jgi:hypothetical protein
MSQLDHFSIDVVSCAIETEEKTPRWNMNIIGKKKKKSPSAMISQFIKLQKNAERRNET